MSDSSDEEDLSQFREAVDSSFTKLIDQSRGKVLESSLVKGKQTFLLLLLIHFHMIGIDVI